jgi:hypothetical protein
MFNRAEIACPILDDIGRRFLRVGEFYSVFFRPANATNFGQGHQALLLEMLRANYLTEAVPKLDPLNYSAATKFSVLNRYEFEGSLINVLLDGTCTEKIVVDEREAYEAARAILKGTVLKPNGARCAFRMDDPSWSALTNGATLSWAYFAYESSQQLWWFVCFADYY